MGKAGLGLFGPWNGRIGAVCKGDKAVRRHIGDEFRGLWLKGHRGFFHGLQTLNLMQTSYFRRVSEDLTRILGANAAVNYPGGSDGMRIAG